MNMKRSSFWSTIINFFKRIFRIEDKKLLPEQAEYETQSNKDVNIENFRKNIAIPKKEESDNSDKNITMFLYKQIRLGNLEYQYIPDEYLEKIKALLKEEKKMKQDKINAMNYEIKKNEQIINQYNKK